MANITRDTFNNLNHLLAQRATESSPESYFLIYPKSSSSKEYFRFTAAQLQDLAGRAVTRLAENNLGSVVRPATNDDYRKPNKSKHTEIVVAVLGKPGVDYIITFLALCQLGYSVLMLSPHLSEPACTNLLRQTDAKVILVEENSKQKDLVVSVSSLTRSFEYPSLARCLSMPSSAGINPDTALSVESSRTAFILHSSGTTSLPRPITFSHQRMLNACIPVSGLKALLLSPVYHTHGLCVFYQRLFKGVSLHILHPETPQTPESLVQTLRDARPEIVYTVPFNLRLIADHEDGIKLLKECKAVSFAGARCPDELGSRLVTQGVHLGSVYGT